MAISIRNLFLIFGICFIIFHRQMASHTASKWHYASENYYKIPFLLGGIFFTIFGLLVLLNIIVL